jgi:glycosyltransferase involved in cell wall biosynthesis
MAYGRPVVASRIGGLVDLDEGAVLVPPGDVQALRAELNRLLQDAEERRGVGARARSLAREQFGTQAAAARLSEAYVSSIG